MKKRILVYVVLYNGKLLGVCHSIRSAREFCKMHVIELNYHVDLFEVLEHPLL